MKWTKQHSLNTVAAKRRLRIQRAQQAEANLLAELKALKPPKLPRLIPDFRITIRIRSGEKIRITATRWGRLFITSDGIKSARAIGRGLEILLRQCALPPPT